MIFGVQFELNTVCSDVFDKRERLLLIVSGDEVRIRVVQIEVYVHAPQRNKSHQCRFGIKCDEKHFSKTYIVYGLRVAFVVHHGAKKITPLPASHLSMSSVCYREVQTFCLRRIDLLRAPDANRRSSDKPLVASLASPKKAKEIHLTVDDWHSILAAINPSRTESSYLMGRREVGRG